MGPRAALPASAAGFSQALYGPLAKGFLAEASCDVFVVPTKLGAELPARPRTRCAQEGALVGMLTSRLLMPTQLVDPFGLCALNQRTKLGSSANVVVSESATDSLVCVRLPRMTFTQGVWKSNGAVPVLGQLTNDLRMALNAGPDKGCGTPIPAIACGMRVIVVVTLFISSAMA